MGRLGLAKVLAANTNFLKNNTINVGGVGLANAPFREQIRENILPRAAANVATHISKNNTPVRLLKAPQHDFGIFNDKTLDVYKNTMSFSKKTGLAANANDAHSSFHTRKYADIKNLNRFDEDKIALMAVLSGKNDTILATSLTNAEETEIDKLSKETFKPAEFHRNLHGMGYAHKFHKNATVSNQTFMISGEDSKNAFAVNSSPTKLVGIRKHSVDIVLQKLEAKDDKLNLLQQTRENHYMFQKNKAKKLINHDKERIYEEVKEQSSGLRDLTTSPKTQEIFKNDISSVSARKVTQIAFVDAVDSFLNGKSSIISSNRIDVSTSLIVKPSMENQSLIVNNFPEIVPVMQTLESVKKEAKRTVYNFLNADEGRSLTEKDLKIHIESAFKEILLKETYDTEWLENTKEVPECEKQLIESYLATLRNWLEAHPCDIWESFKLSNWLVNIENQIISGVSHSMLTGESDSIITTIDQKFHNFVIDSDDGSSLFADSNKITNPSAFSKTSPKKSLSDGLLGLCDVDDLV